MKKVVLIFSMLPVLSGCAFIKTKIAAYYISKAEKPLSSRTAIADAEFIKAYGYVEKALEYDPKTPEAVQALDKLTDAAYRAGFSNALEIEINIFGRYLKNNPHSWEAYLAIINSVALVGDLYFLNDMVGVLSKMSADLAGKPGFYEAKICLALVYAAMAPWVESQGYVNVNKNSNILLEKTKEYAALLKKLLELKQDIAKIEASNPEFKKQASSRILSSYEVAVGDVFKNQKEIARMFKISEDIASDEQFAKAVELTVLGNAYLAAREYSKARAMYQGALSNYPDFIDARKQMLEADFQEGAGLGIIENRLKTARQLLYSAYEDSEDVIEFALEKGNFIPFLSKEKFIAEIYSLKAAIISAINAVDRDKLKGREKWEMQFKYLLEEALKFNPENRLAMDLLDRYKKEGF